MSEINERVAILEARMERMESDIMGLFDIIRKHMEHEDKVTDEIRDSINEIATTQKTSKSFIGGVVFVVSGLWAAITLLFSLKGWK